MGRTTAIAAIAATLLAFLAWNGAKAAEITLPKAIESAPTQVLVDLVIGDELPAMSEAAHTRIFRRAGEMVKNSCDIVVNFRIDRTRSMGAFLKEQRARIAPYEVHPAMSWDVFETKPERYQAAIAEKIRAGGSLPSLRPFMSSVKPEMNNDEAATAIAQAYMAGIGRLAGMHIGKKRPLLRREDWKDHSLMNWGVLIESEPWKQTYKLYLSNWILVEDSIGDAPLLTLEKGGVVNAVTLLSSRTVLIGYGSILSDELTGGNPKLKGMSEADKEEAIAYVIAQHVGAYMLRNAAVSYSVDGGIANPIQMLQSPRELYLKDKVKIAPRKGETLLSLRSTIFKTMVRMDIHRAQGNWEDVIEEARHLEGVQVDVDTERQVALRVMLAAEQIRRERNK